MRKNVQGVVVRERQGMVREAEGSSEGGGSGIVKKL